MNRFFERTGAVLVVLACARILMLLFCAMLLGSCISLNTVVGEHALVYPDGDVSTTGKMASITWSQFKKMGRAGTLLGTYIFQPGEYPLEGRVYVQSVGTLHLIGSDRVRFSGAGESKDKGFVLASSHIFISDFYFNSTSYCFKPDKNKSVSDVLIVKLSAESVNDCILIDRDTAQSVSGWVIQNIQVKNYYRSAVRIAGRKTHNINLYDFILDGGKEPGYCWKGGVQIYNSVSNISIYRGRVSNNIGGCQGLYQQGDGIEIDHKDGVPTDISIGDVLFCNNSDADLDAKSSGLKLENLYFLGGNGRYAIKLWSYKYDCATCYVSGEAENPIKLKDSDFYRGASPIICSDRCSMVLKESKMFSEYFNSKGSCI